VDIIHSSTVNKILLVSTLADYDQLDKKLFYKFDAVGSIVSEIEEMDNKTITIIHEVHGVLDIWAEGICLHRIQPNIKVINSYYDLHYKDGDSINDIINLVKEQVEIKVQVDTNQSISLALKTKEGEMIPDKYIVHKYRTPSFASEISKLINDKWWFKYYFRSPTCAKGRLVQFGGTCWLNTLLNSIILGQRMKKYAIDSYLRRYKGNLYQPISAYKTFSNGKDNDNSCSIDPDVLYGMVFHAMNTHSLENSTNVEKFAKMVKYNAASQEEGSIMLQMSAQKSMGYDSVVAINSLFGAMFEKMSGQ
jgi:hypothetical protein